MSFEAFRVELRGGSATPAQVKGIVRRLPHVRPDPESIPAHGSTYYVVHDGRHAMEIEVVDSPVRISCRFTLCHPPSIDAAFLELLHELMSSLGMTARICGDRSPRTPNEFPAARFSEFAAAALASISERRAEWVTNFGPVVFSATTPQAYEKFILPRCEPTHSRGDWESAGSSHDRAPVSSPNSG